MEEFGKMKNYKSILIRLLREGRKSMEEIEVRTKEILMDTYGLKEISRRTIDRAKKSLLEDGYVIKSKKFEGCNFFVLESSPEFSDLTEEEKLTFPLLLGLLETEKNMNAVEWLKTALIDEFNFSKEDVTPYPYFVHIQPTLTAQDQLLVLAGKIIEYIKRGQAIKFLYDKKGNEEFKQVAPLQIRYYDNRYYLLGTTIDENTYKPRELLQTFTLDKFIQKQVYPAIEESEEDTTEDIHIYYNYETLFKVTNLEYLLNNSLGIWYDWKQNKLKTFRLKFTDWAMGIVENKKIHPSQVVKEKNRDFLILEITVWDNLEIDYFVDRFGDKCERLN